MLAILDDFNWKVILFGMIISKAIFNLIDRIFTENNK